MKRTWCDRCGVEAAGETNVWLHGLKMGGVGGPNDPTFIELCEPCGETVRESFNALVAAATCKPEEVKQ